LDERLLYNKEVQAGLSDSIHQTCLLKLCQREYQGCAVALTHFDFQRLKVSILAQINNKDGGFYELLTLKTKNIVHLVA